MYDSSLTNGMVVLWWLSFWTALGLCLGSFLNVVIYRLPRDRSLRDPLWSACPCCHHRIVWYDNIPIVSFFILGGRCRRCDVPISAGYLLVECMMALIVLMLLDAFFIGQVRTGLSNSRFGLTDHFASDWPILLAHVILFGSLLSMSIIDMEHYWVDIRFTNLAALAGFVLHALWTPKHSSEWVRPWDSTAVMCLAAGVGLGITWLLLVCSPREDLDDREECDAAPEPVVPSSAPPRRSPPPSLIRPSRVICWVAVILLAGMFIALLVDETGLQPLRHAGRTLVLLLLVFGLIVWASTVQRPSDQEIAEAIHQERHNARRMVLKELALLLPAVFAAFVGLWIMRGSTDLSAAIGDALHRPFIDGGTWMPRHWNPLQGLATAASGYIIAGAIGWFVRIVFTLVFGKEAFGTGDIHLMAAAGCIAGWPVVVLGFFLTCGLAIVGWVATLPFKRSRALPLGPWLSLSFLTVVVFYDSIIAWPPIARVIDLPQMWDLQNSQVSIPGILP